MQTKGTETSWNEIQFLDWTEFKNLAPTILKLEVTRLGKIIESHSLETEFHNSVVRARFELGRFIACLESAEKGSLEVAATTHLENAVMSISVPPPDLDAENRETCRYVLDRLTYVHHRIHLLY